MARGGPNRPSTLTLADRRAGGEDRYEERYQAAARYYVQGETMEAIARQLTLSRSTVSRLLQEAREQGMVRITLADHAGSASSAAVALGQQFGVRVHLVAVRSGATASVRLDRVAKFAGNLLTSAVADHQVIGVAWGVTVSRVVQHLSRRPLVGATAVQLNGGGNPRGFGITYTGEILRALGDAFEAELVLFPLPAFFDQTGARELMWRERSVQQVLALRNRVDVAVFGVGGLSEAPASEVYRAGYLDDSDLERLASGGVVGDVCTVLLREDGSWSGIQDNERATGPTPRDLQRIPRRICVVADPARAAAVVGALRAGVATDLVIDEETARAVLDRLRTPRSAVR
jgi:DNA-binding transcriptional regulator LsrR (DeoR family)